MQWILLAFLVVFGGWFLYQSGPVVPIEEPPALAALPEDLEQFLRDSEAAVPDLDPDVAKTIVWADAEQKSRTEFSLVYLHGFSATHREISPVPEQVARSLGANLFLGRLQGHGQSSEAMAEPEVRDWLLDGLEALEVGRRLGDRVILMGTSTGATLGTWLLSRPEASSVDAAVWVSPNFHPKDRNSRMLLQPWGLQLVKLVIGDYRSFEPASPEQARFWTTRYRTEALLPMMGLVKLVEELDVAAISTPLLIAYSPLDEVIDAELVASRFQEFGSQPKKLVKFEATRGSHHVIAGDILAPENNELMIQTTLDFLKQLN